MKLPFLVFIEAWAVARLIRSPAFNRVVHSAYRKLNRLPPLEPPNGGGRTGPSRFDFFKDEIKEQFRELTWQNKRPRK